MGLLGLDFLFVWGGVDVLWWLVLEEGDEVEQLVQCCDVVGYVLGEGFLVGLGCVFQLGVFEVWWELVVDGVLCQVRVEVGVGGGGGVLGVGEVRRYLLVDFVVESIDYMYVVFGVWVEEILVVGVEIDVFDVDVLGGG